MPKSNDAENSVRKKNWPCRYSHDLVKDVVDLFANFLKNRKVRICILIIVTVLIISTIAFFAHQISRGKLCCQASKKKSSLGKPKVELDAFNESFGGGVRRLLSASKLRDKRKSSYRYNSAEEMIIPHSKQDAENYETSFENILENSQSYQLESNYLKC